MNTIHRRPGSFDSISTVLANLQNAWQSATPDEQREICNIILDKIVYDLGLGKIAKIIPKPEYEVLFRIVDTPEIRADAHAETVGHETGLNETDTL